MDFKELEQAIIFEDEVLLVINKPAGWVVNRSKTYSDVTVQDWMEKRLGKEGKEEEGDKRAERVEEKEETKFDYGTPEEIFAQRSGIVHRLDKETSGVLLLAKTPEVLVELMRQFQERETKKTYIALVHGKMIPAEGEIRVPMGRSENDRKKFAINVEGKMSETEYRLLEYYPGLPKGMHQKKGASYQGFSLVELKPKTGRTHQIRVHMAAIKHPVVGDSAYAGKKRAELDGEWCKRQFLHARELCIQHPINKSKMCFEAPLAKDLEAVRALFQQEE